MNRCNRQMNTEMIQLHRVSGPIETILRTVNFLFVIANINHTVKSW